MSEVTFYPRPSGAGQWIVCHGAPKLEAIYPEDRDSEAAREGTAAHWARAEVLNGRAVAVGQVTDDGFVLTEAMVEAARVEENGRGVLFTVPVNEIRGIKL